MGFYGNITNTTKTSFSFDRTYPNRTEMEASMTSDGVYIGRFVLVDYDQDSENVRRVYYNLDSLEEIGNNVQICLYSDAALIHKIQFNSTGIILDENNLVTGVNKNDIVYVKLNDGTKDFFVCTGEYTRMSDDGNTVIERYAHFERFTQGPDYEGIYRWNYAVNYNIDQVYYGDKFSTSIGRGWDSTVWQKVFQNGEEKYVMVAELNSVVPTFTISPDAPTIAPIAPHFDEISNNTFYELHAQPQWGMRIRQAGGYLSEPSNNEANGLSDVKGFWIQSVYNKVSDVTEYFYLNQDFRWQIVDLPLNPGSNAIPFEDAYKYISEQEDSLLPLGIYFNKKGFDSNVQYENEIADNISILPTGYSQTPVFIKNQENGSLSTEWKITEYNDHSTGASSPQIDTLEMQILLPSLGNAINEMWDLVYGVGSDGKGHELYQYDTQGNIITRPTGRPKGINDKPRQTFVDWVDGDDPNDEYRLRLVKEKEAGNGFDYEPKEIETLAGCINSVHDLMGMIVVDKSDLDINDEAVFKDFVKNQTDADKIYYLKDGGYYRRGIGYEYTTLDYRYEKIEVTEDNYQENFYYYLENNSYKLDLNNSFDSTKEYYVKKIRNPEEEYKLIELDQYSPYQYYYRSGDNYRNEKNPVARNVQYFKYNNKIKKEENISMDFEKEKYWELNNKGDYLPTNDKTPGQDKYYIIGEKFEDKTEATCLLEDPKQYDKDTELYKGNLLTYFWSPGAFAIKVGITSEGEGIYELTETDSEFDPNLNYYMLDFNVINGTTATGETYYIPGSVKHAYRVKLIKIGSDNKKYYKQEYNKITGKYSYYLLTQQIIDEEYKDFGRARLQIGNSYPDDYTPKFGEKNHYYTLNEIQEYSQDLFYVANKYYYIDTHEDEIEENDNRGNFIKDKSPKYTKDRTYYTLLEDSFIPIKNPFYIPNKYYQRHVDNNGNISYILDKSFIKNDQPYYERIYFYVQSDLEGLYAVGSQWNRGIEGIPCTIELASIKEVNEMKLLNGFARTFNTIHGLIVAINQILLSGDYNTRDRNTVQGCINLLNDIINRFDEFLPGRLLISDNYGRVSSAEEASNGWIDIDIISDPNKPKIKIDHIYPYKQTNTTSQENLNDSNNDTINLETINFDATGHVTKIDTETITLPYGYKTFSDGTNNAIAANTHDTFTFSDDTWVSATINNKTLQIAHEAPNEATSTIGEAKNRTLNFGDTFKTLSLGIDDKGHIKVSNERIITLPKGSLDEDFSNDNNARVLTGIGFNPSIGKISYSKNNIGNLLLTGYVGSNPEEVNASDSINQAFSKLQNNLNNTNNSITEIKTALGVTEDNPTLTSVAAQIAAALEDALKDYATISYVNGLVNPSTPPESGGEGA